MNISIPIYERLELYSEKLYNALKSVDYNELEKAHFTLMDCMNSDYNVFVCGNGGSLTMSDHFACDHGKGSLYDTGNQFNVYPLTTGSLITAIANDIGYEQIFSYQLAMRGKPGDVLVAVSASGNSPNIISALEMAKKLEIATIAFVGFDGGKAKDIADIVLHVNEDNYGVVEDAHQALMHILAQQMRVNNSNKSIEDIKL